MSRARPAADGDLRGRRVTLVGLGTFGGAVGAARYLAGRGADLLVTDLRSETDLAESLRALEGLGATFRLGEHREEDVREADLVVLSPAVPPHAAIAKAARDGLARCTSEMNLLWEALPDRPVGVTGTRGKSTTTALLHAMVARHDPRARLGGNLGGSLLPEVDRIPPGAPVILELSSFQLHWLRELRASPRVAVVTNIAEHHLDWHGGMASYVADKRTIVEFQGPDDVAILNADDPSLRLWEDSCRGKTWWYSVAADADTHGRVRDGRIELRIGSRPERILPVDEIPMPGSFQVQNVLAAALAARALDVPPDAIREAILAFPGLPHRLERVGEVDGVLWINDSKGTTPEAAAAALEALPGPLLWIGGGVETGEPFEEVARAAGRARRAYLIGESAPRIGREMEAAIPDRTPCETLEEAVALARADARPGETVVLSPGCASYDQFLNYEERGEAFRRAVLGDQ